MRIGQGYDIHRLEPGNKGVYLGGVLIECPWHIVAHSDGDVLIHALCDALLGAAGLGDIGEHFPDTDAVNAGRDSKEFLAYIYRLIKQQGYVIINTDITLLTQVPRLSPYKSAIKEKLAEILNIDSTQINIKATTMEGLDAIGQKQGIACQAIVLINKE